MLAQAMYKAYLRKDFTSELMHSLRYTYMIVMYMYLQEPIWKFPRGSSWNPEMKWNL